jgi:hypothetical protein
VGAMKAVGWTRGAFPSKLNRGIALSPLTFESGKP